LVISFDHDRDIQEEGVMKIYVASSFLNKDNARLAMDMLENAGHTITNDWTKHHDAEDLSLQDRARDALEDLSGVRDAQAVVFLWPWRFGGSSELGIALALNKYIIVVGGVQWETNIFLYHPDIHYAAMMTDAIQLLKPVWELEDAHQIVVF
jgi:hypothetical protein